MTPLTLDIDVSAARLLRAHRFGHEGALGKNRGDLLSGHGWLIVGVISIAVVVFLLHESWRILAGAETVPPSTLWIPVCLIGLPAGALLSFRFACDLTRWIRSGFLSREPVGAMIDGLHYGRFTVRLDDQGLSQEADFYAERIAWDAITGVFPDRGWLCLVSGAQAMALLPQTPEVEAFLAARGLRPS